MGSVRFQKTTKHHKNMSKKIYSTNGTLPIKTARAKPKGTAQRNNWHFWFHVSPAPQPLPGNHSATGFCPVPPFPIRAKKIQTFRELQQIRNGFLDLFLFLSNFPTWKICCNSVVTFQLEKL
jgi:hypothetical protein